MAATKEVKYNDEMVAFMTAEYKAAPTRETVNMLAEKFGKNVKSITTKLALLGIYQKPERVSKSGEAVISKDKLAQTIGEILGLTEADVDSLTKANKTALQTVLKAIS